MTAKKNSNTPRRTTATPTKRRTAPPKRNGHATPHKAPVRPMPCWMRNGLAAAIILVFAAGFYWFGIRPYAYRWKPCYGQKGYGVCMPYRYDVHGIDISHYQGEIDWKRLAQNRQGEYPLRFVFMKATEGGNLADDMFRQNFDSAGKYGFIRGAYHFFVPRTDARKQADFFIRTARLREGDLPPVLDVETTGKKSAKELKEAVKTWLDCVEAHYGVKPILYTSYKFKMRYLNDSVFGNYPYWIAHYYVDSVRYRGRWHFWQHTDVGSVPGIDEDVDLNVFNGTQAQLDSMRMDSSSADTRTPQLNNNKN